MRKDGLFELVSQEEVTDEIVGVLSYADFPIINPLVDAIKLCSGFEKYKFLKNSKSFLEGFRSGDLDEDRLIEYKKSLRRQRFL